MTWITVNEDLPKNNQFVEVIIEANFTEASTIRSRQIFIGEFSRDRGWRVNECTGKLPAVICWKPFDEETACILAGKDLPKPFKKATDAQI